MQSRGKVALCVALVLCLATISFAQQRQGGRQGGRQGRQGGSRFGGGGFGGGGTSRLALLQIEAVQKELELLDDQIAQIRKLQEEARSRFRRPGGDAERRRPGGDGERRPGGGRRRGGDRPAAEDPKDDEASLQLSNGLQFVWQQEEEPRRRFQDMTEEERREFIERMRKEAEKRTKEQNEKLAKILLPHQTKRLNEIYIQVLGTRALDDAEVGKKLKITDKQRKRMSETRNAGNDELRSQMRELFQAGGFDRDKMREKMSEFRKKQDEKVMDVLTSSQREQFAKMKGKEFKMPEGALRSRFGGGRPGGGRPSGQRRPDA